MRTAYYPWSCQSPEMNHNLLLMCKLLLLLLVFNGFYGYITDPYIPFFSLLDRFHAFPGLFEYSLKAIFLIAGFGLLFNVRVRTMAILLGLCTMLVLAGSKPVFRNHIFICGCIFLLCGLTKKDQYPWLLIVQFSLVYFGAALNKIVQLDWWNGQFMHNMLLHAFGNPYYELTHEWFSERWLARLISWGSIAFELSISVLLLFRKWHRTAFWSIVIFHASMFAFTGFRFGHFFEDALIYLLAFSAWPEGDIEIVLGTHKRKSLRKLVTLLNWNGQFRVINAATANAPWLQIRFSNETQTGFRALGSLLRFTPATFIFLLFFDTAIQFLFGQYAPYPVKRYGLYIITMSWLWGAILFYGYLWWNPLYGRPGHVPASHEGNLTA